MFGLRLKNKVLTFSLMGSFLIHVIGFTVLRVKGLQAAAVESYLEVGFYDAKWSQPLLELPGDEDETMRIFEAPMRWNPVRDPHSFLQEGTEARLPAGVAGEDFLEIERLSQPEEDRRLSGAAPSAGERLEIQGPAAKRKILFRKNPKYPLWARQYGLEFDVGLKFWVTQAGDVELAVIERSSGYPEVDAKVVRAMKRWKFEAQGHAAAVQWGTVLFKFRLKR